MMVGRVDSVSGGNDVDVVGVCPRDERRGRSRPELKTEA